MSTFTTLQERAANFVFFSVAELNELLESIAQYYDVCPDDETLTVSDWYNEIAMYRDSIAESETTDTVEVTATEVVDHGLTLPAQLESTPAANTTTTTTTMTTTTTSAYESAYASTLFMKYNELRAALKVLRSAGHEVPSLRSKKPVLAHAYATIIASQAADAAPTFFTDDEIHTCIRRYFVDSSAHTVVRPAGGALAIRHEFDFGAPACPVCLVPVITIAAFYGGVDLPAPYNPSCPLPTPMTYQLCLPAARPIHFTQADEFTCLPSGGRHATPAPAARRRSAATPLLIIGAALGALALGAAFLVGVAYKLISDAVDYCML